MRSFIFITTEGFTYQPNSESIEPDVQNCQVLGFGEGKDEKDAFEEFKRKLPWLLETSFNELIFYELKNEKGTSGYFYINE